MTLDKTNEGVTPIRPKLTLGLSKKLSETTIKKIEALKPKAKDGEINIKAKVKSPRRKEEQVKAKASEKKNGKANTNGNTKTVVDASIKDKGRDAKTEGKKETKSLKPKKWLLEPSIFKEMMTEFKTDFPNCFTIPKKPLALNIRLAMIEAKPEYNPDLISAFFKVYCRGIAYKTNLVLGAERVDLNGEVSSLVTAEQLAKDKTNKYKINLKSKDQS